MDKYRVLGQIGEGTYGKVYKAVNIKTNEIVAIKMLNVIDKEEGVSYSALQEVKYLRQLADCNRIMKLLDVFIDQSNNNTVMVFPYADADLTGLLSRSSSFRLSLSQAKGLFKQLLQGMAQLHSRNLVHRDIKAANLLIHKGELFLGDFGMTTNYKNHTVFSPNVVTLWYRAPELLLGSTRYGPEIDIWSCGCILVELLTCQNPFPGMTEQHQMDLIFKVIGTPDASTWGPSLEQLPGFKTLRKGLYKSTLRHIFREWDPEALDLLEKLLAPPHLRITAAQALQHSFFKAEPLPCLPSEMGAMPTIHEYEIKKRKMEQHYSQYQQRQSSNAQYSRNDNRPNVESRNHLPQQQYPHQPQHQTQPVKEFHPPSRLTQQSHPENNNQHSTHNSSTNGYRNNNSNNNNHQNYANNNANANNVRRRVFISRDRQEQVNPSQQQPPRPSQRLPTQQTSPQTSPQHTPAYQSGATAPVASTSSSLSGYTRSVPKPTMRISSSRQQHSATTSTVSSSHEEPAIKKQRTFPPAGSVPTQSHSSNHLSSISTSTSAMTKDGYRTNNGLLPTPIVIASITEDQKRPLSSTTVSSC